MMPTKLDAAAALECMNRMDAAPRFDFGKEVAECL